MIFQLIISDSPNGVKLSVRGGDNDITDHPDSSLAAMWVARIYRMFEESNQKGYLKVLTDDSTNSLH